MQMVDQMNNGIVRSERKRLMRRFLTMSVGAALLLPAMLLHANDNAFAGRWDLTITSDKGTYPDWMEVTEDHGNPKVRVQLRTGNVHPVDAKMDGSKLIVTVPAPNDAPSQSDPYR